MADYSINAIARKVSYTGSAGVGPYAFSFEVLDQTDVAVYKNATLLTLTTDYTVTVNANGTGSVTLVVAATAADTIVILGARDIERTTDFVTAGDLRASSLNEQLDSLTIFDQQIDERVERSIKAPPYDPTGINMVLPSKADRADKLLKFDTEGNVEAAGADDVFTGTVLGANYVSDTFTGNGSTTAYTLSQGPGSKLNTQVYIDGVYQEKSTYSLTGSTLTFTEAPPLNASIEVISGDAVSSFASDASQVNYDQGSTGFASRTVASKLQEFVSVKDFGAVGDGSTDDAAAFTAAANAINAAGGGNLYIPSSSGNYVIETNVTIQSTVNLVFDGGVINVPSAGGATLTIYGGVATTNFHTNIFVVSPETAANSQVKIRNENATTEISPYVTEMSAFWFNGTTIAQKINKAYQAGGARTTVRIPAGIHPINTPVIMDQTTYGSNLVLRGESHIASTLQIAGGSAIVGINASNGDECLIDQVRVTEETGSVTSVGLLCGGTSLVVNNCWFSNTKYAILVNSGSGMHIDGCYVEASTYGMMMASNFADYDIGGMNDPSSLTNCRIDRLFLFNCGAGNQQDPAGLRIDGSYSELNISSASGAFTVGETVTGGTSSETAVVVSYTTGKIIVNTVSGAFTNGETITGGTSGQTATLDSSNSNDIRDIQFSSLQVRECSRHGAVINDCSTISVQGNFAANGTNASSTAAGCFIGDNVEQITFTGSGFFDNTSTADSYGIHVNGSGSRVSLVGCTLTNDQSSDQDYGIRRQDGTVHATGCIMNGNSTAATTGTVTSTANITS